tara:strand:+ start:235 stop:555 length:321 start_codon:yes stop_codon:yes gene_type:complete
MTNDKMKKPKNKMTILELLSLSEVPKLQIGDTVLTIWDNGNLAGRKWCEREPLEVMILPDNIQEFWIKLGKKSWPIELGKVLLNPKSELELIGKNEDGKNYWIVKI